MFVYKITNQITSKIYIGQHKGDNLKRYFQKKFSSARHAKGSSHLFNSMRKHPLPCDWSIEPVALIHGDMPKVVMDSVETLCIAYFDARNPEVGYNICRGGEGHSHTPWNKGKKGLQQHTEEWKAAASLRLLGNKFAAGQQKTEEWREATSKANKGNKYRLGLEPWNKGKECPSSRGNKHRLGLEPWNKGKGMSPEQFEKCKATMFKKQSHCKNGHELTPENTLKSRGCKICKNAHERDKYRQQKLQSATLL